MPIRGGDSRGPDVFPTTGGRAGTARADASNDDGVREIRSVENPDGRWTARDLQVDVSAQGETRETALTNLDDVVDAVCGYAGHEPTDEELRELSVDPEVARSQGDGLPDALR